MKNKKHSEIDFLNKYLNDFSKLIKPEKQILIKLKKAKDLFVKTSKRGGKIIIFGNGGSAAIASHVSVDLTKNARIRSVNFNESDLITCFSNDYGYERWVEKSVDFYADKKDILVLISSSGKSMNMINACKTAKKKKLKLFHFLGIQKTTLYQN